MNIEVIKFKGKDKAVIYQRNGDSENVSIYTDLVYSYIVDTELMASTRRYLLGSSPASYGRSGRPRLEEPTKVLYRRVPISRYDFCIIAINEILA